MPAAARVIPVAPVNPSAAAQESASVVNDINPAVQARANESAKADPLQGGSQADTANKGWTQRKEAVSKPEELPPKEPLSKMLMDHIHNVWSASARVVEIWLQNNPTQNQNIQQVQQQQQAAANRNTDPLAAPGNLAKEVLTYSPTRIKRPEKAE